MYGLALERDTFYFVEADNDAIYRARKSGGRKELFAAPVFRGALPNSLLSDGTSVYWVDDDTLYRKAQ